MGDNYVLPPIPKHCWKTIHPRLRGPALYGGKGQFWRRGARETWKGGGAGARPRTTLENPGRSDPAVTMDAAGRGGGGGGGPGPWEHAIKNVGGPKPSRLEVPGALENDGQGRNRGVPGPHATKEPRALRPQNPQGLGWPLLKGGLAGLGTKSRKFGGDDPPRRAGQVRGPAVRRSRNAADRGLVWPMRIGGHGHLGRGTRGARFERPVKSRFLPGKAPFAGRTGPKGLSKKKNHTDFQLINRPAGPHKAPALLGIGWPARAHKQQQRRIQGFFGLLVRRRGVFRGGSPKRFGGPRP